MNSRPLAHSFPFSSITMIIPCHFQSTNGCIGRIFIDSLNIIIFTKLSFSKKQILLVPFGLKSSINLSHVAQEEPDQRITIALYTALECEHRSKFTFFLRVYGICQSAEYRSVVHQEHHPAFCSNTRCYEAQLN